MVNKDYQKNGRREAKNAKKIELHNRFYFSCQQHLGVGFVLTHDSNGNNVIQTQRCKTGQSEDKVRGVRLTLVDRGSLGTLRRDDKAKALLTVKELDLSGPAWGGR